VEQVFGPIAPAGGLSKPALFALKELGPYLATPARAMARELRRYGCRAILCQEYEFPRFDVAVAIGRMLRMPVYSSFQGGDYRRWALERITRPVAMRLAAGVIVPSSAERERVHAVYGAVNVAQIPNPVDLETWRPSDRAAARKRLGITADAPVAAWHGRVDIRKKGLDTLVDAWAILEAASPELVPTLLLIGTGADAPQLHRRIAERKLRNVVWIDAYLHRPGAIAELLSAADLYVFPSRHEGFPVAPIEAMACGLGLISADVSGVRDVLAGGESAGGLIVPRGDPQRLADQLGRLLREPVRCRRLGRQARSTAARFGRSAIGLQLRDFLLAPGARC
jgi:starch synthase